MPTTAPESLSPDTSRLLERLERLLSGVEALLPVRVEPDWSASIAFRWRRRVSALGSRGELQPVPRVGSIALADLHNIDDQKRLIDRNTRQFVHGLPANNVLLTG